MSDNTPIIVKKKKIQAAGHHGGSWKVAYADFVTAMMAFFMVMWIMGMSAETRSMVAGYFNDPLGFMKNPPKSQSPFATPGSPNPKPTSGISGPSQEDVAAEQLELKKIASQFEAALAQDVDLKELSKHVQVEITEQGLRIELMESAGAVFFESGRDVIRAQAMQLVSKIGPILGKSGRPVIVEGHTDAAPYPSTVYSNWELSSDRATSMRQALTAHGVPLKQFVEIRGFADRQLKNPGDPLHFSNRRVTVFLPFTREIAISDNLPKDALKKEIQGVFNKSLGISPPPKQPAPKDDAPFFG